MIYLINSKITSANLQNIFNICYFNHRKSLESINLNQNTHLIYICCINIIY